LALLALSGEAHCVESAAGPQFDVGFSLGFDSNPAQQRDGPALGFAEFALGAAQPLPFLSGLRLEADVWLRDYAGKNDNGRLDLGLLTSRFFGTTQVDLWAEAGAYRDQLVTTDERNEAALGTLIRRPLGASFDLALFAERRWLDYRNPSLPWAGRPGGIGLSIQGQRPERPNGDQGANIAAHDATNGPVNAGCGLGQGRSTQAHPQDRCPPRISPQQRNDRFDRLSLEATWLPMARLSVTLGLDSGWRDSSIALDSYRQQATRLALTVDPSPTWSLTAEAGLSRRDYWKAPQTLERIDDQRWIGLELHRWLAQGALYCSLDHIDSRSTIKIEGFTQWITACGWQRPF
jgi:hypothetical protein